MLERDVAPRVHRVEEAYTNWYVVEEDGRLTIVDTGFPRSWRSLQAALDELGRSPADVGAVVLTHGHFDHVGSARRLADAWGVPLYAHPLELPYLTGLSDFPPRDPTMGGAMAQMSRFMPDHGYDLGDRLRELPADGSLPGLSGWRWLHTPGHTPGHVSLYREADGVLLAADAFATMNLDSWSAFLTRKRELSRPSPPFTFDWATTRLSIMKLAALEPKVLAAGHGLAMEGDHIAAELRRFTESFTPPRRGRYVGSPPVAGEGGVEELPPPAHDPYMWRAAAVVVGLLLLVLARQRR